MVGLGWTVLLSIVGICVVCSCRMVVVIVGDCWVILFLCLPPFVGRINSPFDIVFSTSFGMRKPYSFVIILWSADLTSDSEH